ncbi:MAG: c-type cytochrome biogenesis protein CcsB [Bacillota bacterium]|nr:c-type cytochrome biogenesis protein CcsB [Bacillota bacterium]
MPGAEANLIAPAFVAYLTGAAAALIYLWTRHGLLARAIPVLTGLGLALHTAALGVRWAAAGHWPFTSLYEFLTLFAWGLGGATLLTVWRWRMTVTAAFTLPLAVGLLGVASLLPSEVRPLAPALQSVWLQLHVAAAILAYAAFTISFALAVLYLLSERRADSRLPGLPPAEVLDRYTHSSVAFGFAFQTLLLITGAVWAEDVWGAWWSWDPKETWALVTWLIYALYLHARTARGWKGRRAAWLAVAGFAAVLFTLLGVSLLIPGLHSY